MAAQSKSRSLMGGCGGSSLLSLNLVSPPSSKRLRTSRSQEVRNSQSCWPVYPSSSASSPAALPRRVHVGEAPTRSTSIGPDKDETLERFLYEVNVEGGSLEVRLMAPGDVGATVKLLAESFADTMLTPPRQVRFLEFWVEQYLLEKVAKRPHAAILVGIYRQVKAEPQLVATAEVSFDEKGASDTSPTPTPPRNAPYISNMTVKKALRKRRIGRNLLKACEELVLKMCGSTKLYLHCRVTDQGPLNMYRKAGYEVVKTDSFLTWLKLQRRNRLMCKELTV